jgi:hypothetical protein
MKSPTALLGCFSLAYSMSEATGIPEWHPPGPSDREYPFSLGL